MKTYDASSGSNVQGVAPHIRLSALVLRSGTLSEMTLPPAGPWWCGSCDRAAGVRTRLKESWAEMHGEVSYDVTQPSLKDLILKFSMLLMDTYTLGF